METLKPDGWPIVSRSETWGGYLPMGISIACSVELTEEEQRECGYAIDKLIEKIRMIRAKNDPEKSASADIIVAELCKCFSDANANPIFIQRIPNEYCSKSCCLHRPWLMVTTHRGPIKIGWRKRVISIDWAASDILTDGCELFADEDVTKGMRHVHAWSCEKATEYLEQILES